jgi:CheY-like chemotaxis protein
MTSPHALVTDPNSDVADTIGAALERRGYTVTTASSVESALALPLPDHIDLVVAHATFPTDDGPTWLEGILNHFPAAAVVITSRFPEGELGLALGRCVYLNKPFGVDGLDHAMAVANALVEGAGAVSPEAAISSPAVIGFEVPVRDAEHRHQPVVALLGAPPGQAWVEAFERAAVGAESPLQSAEAVVEGDRIFLFSQSADSGLVIHEIRELVARVGDQVRQNFLRTTDAGSSAPGKNPSRRS